MFVDFHTHGKLAKYLPFSVEYTYWLFNEAKNSGLDAICLTEHFNTKQFDEVYAFIASEGTPSHDAYIFNGLKIFPGMETDIAEGGHILSVGPMEAILELNRRLEPYKAKGNFLPFAQLMDLFAEYPVFVGGAHPFRAGGHIPELPTDQLTRLDFLDMNGKDLAEDRDRTQRLTTGLGKALGLPVVSGSDTHQAVQYGCVRTRFAESFNTVEALRRAVNGGAYEICISDNAARQVATAALLKRSLKEIHALGGDYVSVLLGKEPAWAAQYAPAVV